MVFCIMEARRYAYYSLVRHRCRLIERGMYAHILQPELPASDWRPALRASYMEDARMLSLRTSLAIRVQRNYMYLFVVTFIGWTFKILSMLDTLDHFPWEYYAPVLVILLGAIALAVSFKVPGIDV